MKTTEEKLAIKQAKIACKNSTPSNHIYLRGNSLRGLGTLVDECKRVNYMFAK